MPPKNPIHPNQESQSKKTTHNPFSSGSQNSKPDEGSIKTAHVDQMTWEEDTCTDHEVAVKGRALDSSRGSSGRERLKRHRVEVAGRVWIPDIWGQEELLKDWIDFDASLVRSSSVMPARAALVEEGRRANSNRLMRIQN